MKKTLIIILATLSIVFVSCKKENHSGSYSTSAVMENIAGAYDVQHNIGQAPFGYNVSLNMEDLSVSRDSLLFIDIISDNEIKTYGFFNSRGVVENNIIRFDSTYCNGTASSLYESFDLSVTAKFENAYYSNGVINLNLHVTAYETNSVYQDKLFKIIAIKH